MDTAFIITAKHPVRGREKAALEFAAESEEYWGKQASEGKCSKPEWFFCPDGTMIWMVKGDRETLEQLSWDDGARRLIEKGEFLMEDWRYTFAIAGDGVERSMALYASVGSELGLL